jgi:hypothetical protein
MLGLHNIHYRTFIISLVLIVSLGQSSFPQPAPYTALLDSVKKYYGEQCTIGVSSSLIRQLYYYSNYDQVTSYLRNFERIKDDIENFRNEFHSRIYDDPALLLNMQNLFEGDEINCVNATGIYFGTDNVNHLVLTYSIVRNSITSFNQPVIQLLNFDEVLRKELIAVKSDWYESAKLKELISFDQ